MAVGEARRRPGRALIFVAARLIFKEYPTW